MGSSALPPSSMSASQTLGLCFMKMVGAELHRGLLWHALVRDFPEYSWAKLDLERDMLQWCFLPLFLLFVFTWWCSVQRSKLLSSKKYYLPPVPCMRDAGELNRQLFRNSWQRILHLAPWPKAHDHLALSTHTHGCYVACLQILCDSIWKAPSAHKHPAGCWWLP